MSRLVDRGRPQRQEIILNCVLQIQKYKVNSQYFSAHIKDVIYPFSQCQPLSCENSEQQRGRIQPFVKGNLLDYGGGDADDYKCGEDNNYIDCKFLEDNILHFHKDRGLRQQQRGGRQLVFRCSELGWGIISSNHCLSLFLVSLNGDVGYYCRTGWFFQLFLPKILKV